MAKNDKQKLSDDDAELKRMEEEEAAALAANAVAASSSSASVQQLVYPPDAPNEDEPIVPTLHEWMQAGYEETNYYLRFGRNPTPTTTAAKPKPVGDVSVVCLKSETYVELGNRRYQFVKGQEIMMNPSHAEEMQQSGWVSLVDVA